MPANNFLNVLINIQANNQQLLNTLKNSNAAVQRFATGVSGVSTSLLAFGVRAGIMGAAISGAFIVGAKEGAKFQNTMSAVRAVVGELSSDLSDTTGKYKLLSQQAIDFGKTSQFSATQAAEGMVALGQAGLTVTQISSALGDVLNLAAAGAISVDKASEITADALQTFGILAENASRVTNALAVAADQSTTDILGIAKAMKYGAPIAAGLGQSIEDLSTSLAVLANRGIKGSTAGTGLANVLSTLLTKSEEADSILRKYGSSFDRVDPRIRSITKIVEEFRDANVSVLDIYSLFEQRAGRTILALRDTSVDSFEKIQEAMDQKFGAAADRASLRTENVAGAFTKLKNAVEAIQIEIFDLFADKIESSVLGLRDFVNSISTFVRNNPGLVIGLTKSVLYFGLFASASGIASIALSNFIGAASNGFNILTRFSNTLIDISKGLLLFQAFSSLKLAAGAAGSALTPERVAFLKVLAGFKQAGGSAVLTLKTFATSLSVALAALAAVAGAIYIASKAADGFSTRLTSGVNPALKGASDAFELFKKGVVSATLAVGDAAEDAGRSWRVFSDGINLDLDSILHYLGTIAAGTFLLPTIIGWGTLAAAIGGVVTLLGLVAQLGTGLSDVFIDISNAMFGTEWENSTARALRRIKEINAAREDADALVKANENEIKNMKERASLEQEYLDLVAKGDERKPLETLRLVEIIDEINRRKEAGLDIDVLTEAGIQKEIQQRKDLLKVIQDQIAETNKLGIEPDADLVKQADDLNKAIVIHENLLKKIREAAAAGIVPKTVDEHLANLEKQFRRQVILDDAMFEPGERERQVKHYEEIRKQLNQGRLSQIEEEIAGIERLTQETLKASAQEIDIASKKVKAQAELLEMAKENVQRYTDEVAQIEAKITAEGPDAKKLHLLDQAKENLDRSKKSVEAQTRSLEDFNNALKNLEVERLDSLAARAEKITKEFNAAKDELKGLMESISGGEKLPFATTMEKVGEDAKRAEELIKNSISAIDAELAATSPRANELGEKFRTIGLSDAESNEARELGNLRAKLIDIKAGLENRLYMTLPQAVLQRQRNESLKLTEGRKDALRELEIEEARVAGNLVKVAELEAERRLEVERKKFDEIFELDGINNDKILAQRQEAEDKLAALNKASIEKARREQSKKGSGFEGNKVIKEGEMTLARQVKSAADLLALYGAIYRIRIDMELRAARAAKKAADEESKLINLRKQLAKEDKDSTKAAILQKRIKEAEKLVDLYNGIANARSLDVSSVTGGNPSVTPTEAAGIQNEAVAGIDQDVRNFEQSARTIVENVKTTLVIGIGGALNNVRDQFANAPKTWVDAFIAGWNREAQRLIDTVGITMHEVINRLMPHMRNSPSLIDVWQMNIKASQKGVQGMQNAIIASNLNLGPINKALSVVNPVMPTSSVLKTLNDNRSLNMQVNSSYDAGNLQRMIANAFGRALNSTDNI